MKKSRELLGEPALYRNTTTAPLWNERTHACINTYIHTLYMPEFIHTHYYTKSGKTTVPD